MDINPQLLETYSWRLLTETVRRAGDRLRIYETHPGGGSYDCLSLFSGAGDAVAHLTRGGSFHVLSRLDGATRLGNVPEGVEGSSWNLWPGVIAAADPAGIVDEICQRIGLTVPSKLPPSTPAVLTYRFITTFLSQATGGRTSWECRSGFLDSSGPGGCRVRSEWFDAFPVAKERLLARDDSDFLNQAAYRFWFILRNSEPVLSLETTGTVSSLSGVKVNISKAYRTDRRIWPIITTIAEDLLR